jgi:hypothetical protein
VSDTGPVTLTKLEAAERQFRQAVSLHFGGVDPVSALTLAAAASEILRDVAKRKGVHHPLHNEVVPLVPPGKRKEFRRLIRKPQNFLKHARRDPDAAIALNPEFTSPDVDRAISRRPSPRCLPPRWRPQRPAPTSSSS